MFAAEPPWQSSFPGARGSDIPEPPSSEAVPAETQRGPALLLGGWNEVLAQSILNLIHSSSFGGSVTRWLVLVCEMTFPWCWEWLQCQLCSISSFLLEAPPGGFQQPHLDQRQGCFDFCLNFPLRTHFSNGRWFSSPDHLGLDTENQSSSFLWSVCAAKV